jgi:hypothetical protein
MNDTGIAQEITTLREQLAAAEAAIAQGKSADASHKDDAELRELMEARDFMARRLSRLESCRRAPEAPDENPLDPA